MADNNESSIENRVLEKLIKELKEAQTNNYKKGLGVIGANATQQNLIDQLNEMLTDVSSQLETLESANQYNDELLTKLYQVTKTDLVT